MTDAQAVVILMHLVHLGMWVGVLVAWQVVRSVVDVWEAARELAVFVAKVREGHARD